MPVKICVYAICKNESKFVQKWLDNMSEADYITVLDTGSTDNTVELLKADPRVTRVEVKEINPWRFDVARNESMKLVPKDADVLVCTDLDELFVPGWAQVIRDNWNGDFNRFFYTYAWSHSETGEPTDVFKYDKIHNREFHWHFPVHEVLWPNDDNVQLKAFDAEDTIYLHHYPDKEKSRSYYFDLLELAVEENPDDSHEQMLLAREYLLADDYTNALENYLKVLHMPDIDTEEKRLVLLESLGRVADCYRFLRNYDEAIWYYQEWIKEDHTYREPYLGLAEIYNDMHMYSLAEAMALAALKNGTRKYTWVERADSWIAQPEDVLAVALFNLGDYERALSYADFCLVHHPDDPRLLKNYYLIAQAYRAQRIRG